VLTAKGIIHEIYSAVVIDKTFIFLLMHGGIRTMPA
jgi:hypothetical protein